MVLESNFVFTLSFPSSVSAAFILVCSDPFDRRASARSLLSCAIPAPPLSGVASGGGNVGFGVLVGLSASRDDTLSSSLVSLMT
jgi:hypothetical protein